MPFWSQLRKNKRQNREILWHVYGSQRSSCLVWNWGMSNANVEETGTSQRRNSNSFYNNKSLAQQDGRDTNTRGDLKGLNRDKRCSVITLGNSWLQTGSHCMIKPVTAGYHPYQTKHYFKHIFLIYFLKTVFIVFENYIYNRYQIIFTFNYYSPKAKLILLNNPRDEVKGIIQQY